MERSATEFRVGLLTLVCLAVFLGLLGIVSGAALREWREVYYVRFAENVKGMAVGSVVNFQGIPIGEVTDMRFDGGDTLVEVEVDPERAVMQASTVARIDRALVTGQVTIELEGYARGGVPLPVGAQIPSVASPIDELADTLPGMLSAIDDTFGRVRVLLDDERLARLDRVLDATERAMAAVPPSVGRVEAAAVATLVELEGAARDARVHMASLDVHAGDVARTIGTARTDLVRVLERLDAAVLAVDHNLATALATIERTAGELGAPAARAVREVRDAVRAVRVLAERLGDAPSSLVWGARADDIDVPATPRGGGR